MKRNKALEHSSIKYALAFSTNQNILPTIDDALKFIAWHSQGRYISPREIRENLGLCRLIQGHIAMGMVLGKVENKESWAYGFKHGWLFLSDFDGDEFDEIKTSLALKRYKEVMGFIPSCYNELKNRVDTLQATKNNK